MFPSVEIRKENAERIKQLAKKQGMNYYSFEKMLIDFFVENKEYLTITEQKLDITEDYILEKWRL